MDYPGGATWSASGATPDCQRSNPGVPAEQPRVAAEQPQIGGGATLDDQASGVQVHSDTNWRAECAETLRTV